MWFKCPGGTTLMSINGKALLLKGCSIVFRPKDAEDEYVNFESEEKAKERFLMMQSNIRSGHLIV